MADLRAITLSQPWATLHTAPNPSTLGYPAKRVESRGWRPNVNVAAGERIAIHAGKGIDRPTLDRMTKDGRYFIDPFARYLQAAGYSSLLPWARDYLDNFEPIGGGLTYSKLERMALAPLPMGAVIGVATYAEVVPGIAVRNMVDEGKLAPIELTFGHYDGPKRWGLVQREILGAIELPEPIPCRGFQQLWHLDKDIAERVLAHVRTVTERVDAETT